ncbi:extracellular solute-binding protein [Catenovulum agarivorans DS-2]|uniref:Extracellular solute-binding protein n=2 Tax=Catenovulum agarivorans TaxID=1172192 RepID=W7QMH1_9ALTE|nr:extracellular solute-binding protein [Catenovulum agarivorans DS-2]
MLICSLILLLNCFRAAAEQPELNVAIGDNSTNVLAQSLLFTQFTKQTGIKINRHRLADIKQLDIDKNWYTHSGKPLDVIFGQISYRLLNYHQQGKLLELTDFWQQNKLDRSFSHLKSATTQQGKILGLPFNLVHDFKREQHISDTDFFAFPKIAEIKRFESVPINAIHVSALGNNQQSALKLLAFLAKAKSQEKLTQPIGTIAANKNARLPQHPFAKKLVPHVFKAYGTSNFFDRSTKPEFEIEARPLFTQFMRTGNIQTFVEQMEALRVKHF